MVVAVDDNIPLLAEALASCADVRVFSGRSLTREQLADTEVLFVRSTIRVNRELLAGTPVRFVGTATAGIDHLDVEYLAQQGISWIGAAGCNAASVAEYVLYAALSWARRHGRLLRNAVIGIVGFGHVGSRVGVLAQKLGMGVLINDPPEALHRGAFPSYCRHTDLAELASLCDILTLHVPLTSATSWPTHHLANSSLLASMQPGSLFIQASRGGVADESALIQQLQAGRIEAAVDVWEQEPVPNGQLVRLCTLATPHIAGHSFEGKLRGSVALAAAFVEWTGLQPDMDILDTAFDSNQAAFSSYSDESHLFELLHTRRRFHEDDAFLRSLSGLSAQEQASRFDAFRRNYPVRRETLL